MSEKRKTMKTAPVKDFFETEDFDEDFRRRELILNSASINVRLYFIFLQKILYLKLYFATKI